MYVGLDNIAALYSNGEAIAGTVTSMLPPDAKKILYNISKNEVSKTRHSEEKVTKYQIDIGLNLEILMPSVL